jgi:hypothetical protein
MESSVVVRDRLMAWLFVMEHLSEVAHVNCLLAGFADVEVVGLASGRRSADLDALREALALSHHFPPSLGEVADSACSLRNSA